VTRYGTSEGCDYRGGDIRVTAVGSEFTVTSPDGETAAFKTRLLGPANVQNLIGAIAVANRMGVSMKALVPAVRALESVPHRLQLLSGGPGVMYIDDAYNANPQGARAALDTLALCEGMARVLLTPGMVELGEQEQELNRQMGEYAAARCDFAILVDPKRGPAIRQGLLDGGFPAERIFSTDSLQKGLDHAATLGTRMVLLLNDLTDQY
jgi:UDP-N-acetylmuramoyl-tripeptide--D-alanyl-D-alanine ligase